MKTSINYQTEKYLKEYEAIINTIQYYIDGSREGKSDIMQPGFHSEATIVGHFGGGLVFGPIQKLYELIDGNGPAPKIESNIASIEIMETIAVVRLEVKHWSGNVVSPDVHMSDHFNLIKTEEGWKISHNAFHLNI